MPKRLSAAQRAISSRLIAGNAAVTNPSFIHLPPAHRSRRRARRSLCPCAAPSPGWSRPAPPPPRRCTAVSRAAPFPPSSPYADLRHDPGRAAVRLFDPFHDLVRFGGVFELNRDGALVAGVDDSLQILLDRGDAVAGGKIAMGFAVAIGEVNVADHPGQYLDVIEGRV